LARPERRRTTLYEGYCRRVLATEAKLDERDTEGIVALAKEALAMKRPDLDAALAQLFALDFARCDAKAVHAVDEAIWVLIAGR
jgi:hypothetical protein